MLQNYQNSNKYKLSSRWLREVEQLLYSSACPHFADADRLKHRRVSHPGNLTAPSEDWSWFTAKKSDCRSTVKQSNSHSLTFSCVYYRYPVNFFFSSWKKIKCEDTHFLSLDFFLQSQPVFQVFSKILNISIITESFTEEQWSQEFFILCSFIIYRRNLFAL